MKFKFNFPAAIFAACIALAIVSLITTVTFCISNNLIGLIVSIIVFCGLVFVIAGIGDSV